MSTARRLHVLHVLDSLEPSGAEISTTAQLPALRGLGVVTTVCHFSTSPGLSPGLRATGFDVVQPATALSRSRRVGFIRRIIRNIDPDVVHTTLFEADIAGRVASLLGRTTAVSSLVNVHYGPEQRDRLDLPRWKISATRSMDAATARIPSRFQAISRTVADTMGARLGIPDDRIEVIPRGRDLSALGRRTHRRWAAARALLGVPDNTHLVVCVARHERQKGLDVLVRAAAQVVARVDRVQFVVAGRSGGDTQAIIDEIEAARLVEHFRLLGRRDDVSEILCAADTFVLPSRWEGLGSVLIEAMALEAPIVVSDLAPVRELLPDDSCAIHVPVDDSEALASGLLDSIADRRQAMARARASRRIAERFDIAEVAGQLADFYDRALASPRPWARSR